MPSRDSFNPSVGILFIQAQHHRSAGYLSPMFQSLGRDSVHSSATRHGQRPVNASFNPSVGILFIQARRGAGPILQRYGFNPSVGILFIQALSLSACHTLILSFQSLGRDSVHSSIATIWRTGEKRQFQSLGRDSVHSSRY